MTVTNVLRKAADVIDREGGFGELLFGLVGVVMILVLFGGIALAIYNLLFVY